MGARDEVTKGMQSSFDNLNETFGKKLSQWLEITEASFDALDKRFKAACDRLANVNSRLQYQFIAWLAVSVLTVVGTLFFLKRFIFILV
ncbi:hypothetical protein [Xenorhabdus bovienii]|uniref:hypothetical protein n=1 Tax=Xenorhabdus bovienii TaxID=40576 RepID=UPI0023B32BD8|nr:hypothetical protein [Xenorhabdus bovienii]MDE9482939.1 hypothetical protein [Xenorhabdus bovienii]MDE9542940.1 hypothetical protein [Xenorhabdus bovienii]